MFNETPAGKMGIASCFSFDPSKIINAFGTGGCVVTENEGIANWVNSIRVHGKSKNNNDFETLGFNSRIPGIQAAILHMQLKQIAKIIEKRNLIANYYNSRLKNIENLKLLSPSPSETWNYHKFPVFTQHRDELKSFLTLNNIETGIHYQKSLPKNSIFGISKETFPISESLSKTELSLPIYPELNCGETKWICDCIIKFHNSKGLC